MINDPQLKRRRGYLLMVIFLFVFIVFLVMSDILIYIFEFRSNPQIQSMNDSFEAVEAIFKLNTGEIYPITLGGRITAFVTLILAISLFLFFAIQVFIVLNSIGARSKSDYLKEKKKIEKKLRRISDLDNSTDDSKIYDSEENIMQKLEKVKQQKEQQK